MALIQALPNTGGTGWAGEADKIIYTFMDDQKLTQAGAIESTWDMKFEIYYSEHVPTNPNLYSYYNLHGNLVLEGTGYSSDGTDNFVMGIIFR